MGGRAGGGVGGEWGVGRWAEAGDNKCRESVLGETCWIGGGGPGQTPPSWDRKRSTQFGEEADGALCSQVGLMGPAVGVGGECAGLRCGWEWVDGLGPGVVEMSCPFECSAKSGG